jgi:hypothetical protein
LAQHEQMALLRCLARRHGLQWVLAEELTSDKMPALPEALGVGCEAFTTPPADTTPRPPGRPPLRGDQAARKEILSPERRGYLLSLKS